MGKRYKDAYGHIPEQAQSLNWLLSQLPLGGKALDIGAGTGKPTADVLASVGHAIHGIEISESMIDVARNKSRLPCFRRSISATSLPSPPPTTPLPPTSLSFSPCHKARSEK